jgi:hypothetical protein
MSRFGLRVQYTCWLSAPIGSVSLTRLVYYGTMTWEVMMNPFYSVVVPADANPRGIVRSKYQQVGGGG